MSSLERYSQGLSDFNRQSTADDLQVEQWSSARAKAPAKPPHPPVPLSSPRISSVGIQQINAEDNFDYFSKIFNNSKEEEYKMPVLHESNGGNKAIKSKPLVQLLVSSYRPR